MDGRRVPMLLSEFRLAYDKCILNELKKEGLDDFETSYGMIVSALTRHKQLTMKELASTITRDKSTVTVLVRNLKQKGYVDYINNPSDQRSKYIVLSDKAVHVADLLDAIGQHVDQKIWSDIEADDVAKFMIVLSKINDNLRNCDQNV